MSKYVTESGRIVETSAEGIRIGDHVSDREKDDRRAVVVRITDTPACDYQIQGEITVADVNEGYDEDETVVEVKFPDEYHASLSGKTYAYPASRLEVLNSLHD